jgi:hypothetical protein
VASFQIWSNSRRVRTFSGSSAYSSLISSIENLLLSKRLPDRLASITAIRQAASEFDEKDVIEDWCLPLRAMFLPTTMMYRYMACENGIQCVGQMHVVD